MTKFDFKQWIINNKAAVKKAKKAKILNEQAPPMTLCSQNNAAGDCHQFQECVNNSFGPTTNFQAGNPFANGDELWLALGQPSQGDVRKDNFGNKYKYMGISDGQFVACQLPTSYISSCCGVAGCMDQSATNYNSAATCGCTGNGGNLNSAANTACCNYTGGGYTECTNCCCRSRMQMKVANPGGGDREFEREAMGENINPTIDAISELITLAEQRRDAKPADRRKPMDKLDPRDTNIEPTMKEPDDEFASSSTSTNTGDPAPMGPCDAGHYEIGGPPWVLQNTFDPDIANLDPATGLCPCDNSNPNNPWGGVTLANVMNPSPQTLDPNDFPVGSSAPCP